MLEPTGLSVVMLTHPVVQTDESRMMFTTTLNVSIAEFNETRQAEYVSGVDSSGSRRAVLMLARTSYFP